MSTGEYAVTGEPALKSPAALLRMVIDGEALHVVLRQRLLLGRAMPDAVVQKVLDLSPYGACEAGVSQVHAALTLYQGRVWVEDRGSAQGTFLNGRLLVPFRRYALTNPCILMMGRLTLLVSLHRFRESSPRLAREQLISPIMKTGYAQP